MKYFIASDIHGSAYYCRKMLEAYRREQAEKMILLGDILYHGPRNDLPREYAPKEVIPLLNAYRDEILAVRGNCDAEVDQMVLEFPIMADYAVLQLKKGRQIYLTHGHIYNEKKLPPMKKGDVLLHGHTHVLRAEKKKDLVFLNPGSVSIPKEGNPPTYAILEKGIFTIRTFEDKTILEYALQKSGKDGDAEGSTV
ncbi:MAG: phosphodiesterase [Lachnospiraceae bacterium]|nr:phosphodiesterase [Lachnospiraceae bacterium]